MNHSEEQDSAKGFLELSDMPSIISESHINTIERYLSSLYYPQEKYTCSQIKLKMLIISYDGLLNHIKRSALKADWLWKECVHNVVHPSPTEWGG